MLLLLALFTSRILLPSMDERNRASCNCTGRVTSDRWPSQQWLHNSISPGRQDYFTVLDIYAFISCRLDYYNLLLYSLLHKLQSVQNATTWPITGTCRDHIMPVLRKLHWLPIWERVKFNVTCLVRQSLSGQAPLYLADDCCLVSNSTRCSLRSADVQTCAVPRTFSTYSNWTIAGPCLCNSLPVQLCILHITDDLFRRHLKGHLFSEPWTQCFVTSDTYLLT